MIINSKEKLVITVNGQLIFKQVPGPNVKITVIKRVEE